MADLELTTTADSVKQGIRESLGIDRTTIYNLTVVDDAGYVYTTWDLAASRFAVLEMPADHQIFMTFSDVSIVIGVYYLLVKRGVNTDPDPSVNDIRWMDVPIEVRIGGTPTYDEGDWNLYTIVNFGDAIAITVEKVA